MRRLTGNPIISPDMLPGNDGDNINGPSLIRAPAWLPRPLGRYYLYFAHHRGSYIRLATADDLGGPWRIHPGGSLRLTDAPACRDHIASPDVHVDDERRVIRLYFHGVVAVGDAQVSFLATSQDGISFAADPAPLANFYLRAIPWRNEWIGMAKGGLLYRSPSGLGDFRPLAHPAFPMSGPQANGDGDVRHVALHAAGDDLRVYFSRIGDWPEQILCSHIDPSQPPEAWRAIGAELVLAPETAWEGGMLPPTRSRAGAAAGRERALRDPAIFTDEGHRYLLYSIAGESGIAIAEFVR